MSHVHAFSCIRTFYSIYFNIFLLLGTFLILSLSLSLSFVCVSMLLWHPNAPKCKSTMSWNPLHSRASTSSDPTPFSVQFCDEKAKSDFFENFSRRGIHSERQVILSDSSDTDLPLPSIVGNGSHCMMSRSLIHPCLSRSFTSTCMDLIFQYLFLLLTFEVRALWSHRIVYPMYSVS